MHDFAAPGIEEWHPAEIARFRAALLGFYDSCARKLPWRDDPRPYAVLVSEFMLQQTRVETVLPYFARWMRRFPDVDALADAPEEEVVKAWEGLGYYSRARNLHGAAREIRARYGGSLPKGVAELRELPGVGPYTAGAVASIAFAQPVPAVDGNVRRVLSRLGDREAPSAGELRAWAGTILDPERPGDFNQALMELGSRVCRPRRPDCPSCPVSAFCIAYREGTQEARPKRSPRRPLPWSEESVAIVAEREGGGFLFRRRPARGLLAGMWEFPGEVDVREAKGRGSEEDRSEQVRESEEARSHHVRERVAEWVGVPVVPHPTRLRALDHVFTHRAVRYHPYLFRLESRNGTILQADGRLRWITPREAHDRFPLPAAQSTLLSRALEALEGAPSGWVNGGHGG